MPSLINDGFPLLARECAAAALTPKELRRSVDEHRLRRIFNGAYVDTAVPDSRWLRLQAIKLVAPPHAVVCGCSASWIFGIDTFRPSERHLLVPSLVVPHGMSRTIIPEVRCRQAILPASDVMESEGVLVTTPLRTTSDLLRKLYRPYALAAADGMARADLVLPAEVVDYVQRLRGYPGIVQGRSLAAMIEPLAESPAESWQRLRLIDAGFPRPTAQFVVVDEHGRERYLDLAYPERLLAIEYDGVEFHTKTVDTDHDRKRRTYLADVSGWRFVVSRKEEILGDDPAFEREVGRLLGQSPLLPRQW